MEKYIKLESPAELDFFTIEEHNGKKSIHLFGYCYDGDDSFKFVEMYGLQMPIGDFVSSMKENVRFVDELYEDAKQGICDVHYEDAVDTINEYFNGNSADYYIDFSEITEETPCGNYVSKTE